MTTSDTPETDALRETIDNGADVEAEMTSLARKLKRERDEAREEWGKASMDAAQLLSEKTKVMAERDEARESLENARELNKWLTVFLEHIRDNADIRYSKHRGLMAFSYLREEASRKWKEAAK